MNIVTMGRRGKGNIDLNENSYIQNGLVFQLDGINKGVVSKRWTDLKGGVYFPFDSGVTSLKNCVEFKTTSGLIGSETTLDVAWNVGTIETAFYKDITGACYILNSQNNQLVFIMGASDVAFSANVQTGGNALIYSFAAKGNYIASMNCNKIIANNNLVTSRKSNRWSYPNLIVGGRKSNYSFIGKIFSIRIYNRHLTQEEMLWNMQIDRKRFGLNVELLND